MQTLTSSGGISLSDDQGDARVKARKRSVASADRERIADWREGGSRDQRTVLIRAALFRAAMEVVGEVGYEQASISRITQRAGVAQGTFYNHFESRQDILDQLLPAVGREMVEHVRLCARKGNSAFEREELGFRAFFSFLKKTPHFFRILNEAESFAPKGYREHLQLVSDGYMRFLRHAHKDGELPGFDERELEVVALVLMSARTYIAWRYMHGEAGGDELPDWVVQAYVKFTMFGLHGRPMPGNAGLSNR